MPTVAENNKRIARNTLMLYIRMFLTIIITFYTSRIVLNALGVEDFGIYGAVGSVVSMFALFSGTLSAAIGRFITFELGKGSTDRLSLIFSTFLSVLFLLAIIFFVLAETLGLWFLNTKMVIPEARMSAANWVFQFSVLAVIVNLLYIPYNAAVIAHEKMSVFAYISVFEALGKLLVAVSVAAAPVDRLRFYAMLMLLISVTIFLVYRFYCKRNFTECKYRFILDKKMMRELFSFAGWNLIGASSAVFREQGGSIVINMFCGATVNAARTIAVQVSQAVVGFVQNFMTALNPQITKSYAAGNKEYMMQLVFQGARLSYYLLLMLSLPVIINTEYILTLWLGNVPAYSAVFVQLALLFALSETISAPLITLMLATGNIRNYQILVGGLQVMNFPVSYILLYCGLSPEWVQITTIFVSQLCLAARLYMLKGMVGLDVKKYLVNVYLNVLLVTIIACILPTVLGNMMSAGFIKLIVTSVVAVLSSVGIMYIVGFNREERLFVREKICVLLKRFTKR
ncbi:MAG: oligosaccharide flippase family protein [Bacteroidaceae bacterium]|nr:oligosaccharide flippase family protein [Bacteroidaceae bacterium]